MKLTAFLLSSMIKNGRILKRWQKRQKAMRSSTDEDLPVDCRVFGQQQEKMDVLFLDIKKLKNL